MQEGVFVLFWEQERHGHRNSPKRTRFFKKFCSMMNRGKHEAKNCFFSQMNAPFQDRKEPSLMWFVRPTYLLVRAQTSRRERMN